MPSLEFPPPQDSQEESDAPLLPMDQGLEDLRRRMASIDARGLPAQARPSVPLIAGAIVALLLGIGLAAWRLLVR